MTNYQKAMKEINALALPFDVLQVCEIADKYNLTDGQLFGVLFGMDESSIAATHTAS